jgi:hypothetical protein
VLVSGGLAVTHLFSRLILAVKCQAFQCPERIFCERTLVVVMKKRCGVGVWRHLLKERKIDDDRKSNRPRVRLRRRRNVRKIQKLNIDLIAQYQSMRPGAMILNSISERMKRLEQKTRR